MSSHKKSEYQALHDSIHQNNEWIKMAEQQLDRIDKFRKSINLKAGVCSKLLSNISESDEMLIKARKELSEFEVPAEKNNSIRDKGDRKSRLNKAMNRNLRI